MASDNYLKNIHSPADIKGMSYAQLNELAAEIRTVLIDTARDSDRQSLRYDHGDGIDAFGGRR